MHKYMKLLYVLDMEALTSNTNNLVAIATYFFSLLALEAWFLSITNPTNARLKHNSPPVIVKPSNALDKEAVTCLCRPNNNEICRQLTFLHAVLVTCILASSLSEVLFSVPGLEGSTATLVIVQYLAKHCGTPYVYRTRFLCPPCTHTI